MLDKFKKLAIGWKIVVGIFAVLLFPFTLIAFGIEFIINGVREKKIIKALGGCVLSIAMIGVLYSAGCFDEEQLNADTKEVTAKVDKETDIKNIVNDNIENLNVENIEYVKGEPDTNVDLIIKMKFPGALYDFDAYEDASNVIKEIEKKYPNEIKNYGFWCMGSLMDKYGNESDSKVLSFEFTNDTISKINWDNAENIMFEDLAENVWKDNSMN